MASGRRSWQCSVADAKAFFGHDDNSRKKKHMGRGPAIILVRALLPDAFSDSFRGQSLRASGSARIFAWSSRFLRCCAHFPSDRLFAPHGQAWFSLTFPFISHCARSRIASARKR